MPFATLAGLEPRDRFATICVKVVRKWEYRGPADDGAILHIDLVLADQEVSKIVDSHSVVLYCNHCFLSLLRTLDLLKLQKKN